MTRTVAEWLSIGALLVMVLAALAGCATPYPLLCRLVIANTGEQALYCAPLPAGTMPKDST